MGYKITRLRPVHGFAAETAGAVTILSASIAGIPVSTTHVICSSIMGVGTTMGASTGKMGRGTEDHVGMDTDDPHQCPDRVCGIRGHPDSNRVLNIGAVLPSYPMHSSLSGDGSSHPILFYPYG